MGITIIDVKVVGMCSKHRKEGDEILKDIHGRAYEDKDISCVGCALGQKSSGKKFNWSNYCATNKNRNQCSKENCTIYSICLIKGAKK